MSGKPYHEGVARTIALLDEVSALERELPILQSEIEALGKIQREKSERLGVVWRELSELLRKMDVSSPGNGGFERRLGWFLAELHRQLDNPNTVRRPDHIPRDEVSKTPTDGRGTTGNADPATGPATTNKEGGGR